MTTSTTTTTSSRKVALVTGSATGVGAASALLLAQRGYNVVINYSKSEAEAREAEAACRAAGADTLRVQASVAEDADCQRLVTATVDRWGRIDTLVNNAGTTTFKGAGRWEDIDASDFERIMRVNVTGIFQMVRAARPHLTASQGSVVNVSSMAGIRGAGSSVPYIASKGAVNSLTLHLARELAPEIRVNAVCPGLITTRWFVDGVGQQGFEKIKAHYENSVPLHRACTAEDVAEAVVWLAAGAATVTGELLMLDSGMNLGLKASANKPGPAR